MSAAPIYPRLSPDAVILPSAGGALVRNDGNVFVLPEPGAYELLRDLAPTWTGCHSLDEICAPFDGAERARIQSLVEHLIARGVLRDRCPAGSAIPDIVRARFSDALGFLAALADDPEERFERFRRSAVLLLGGGHSFWRCAAALVRNGLERLSLAVLQHHGEHDGRREIEREVNDLREHGIPVRLSCTDRGDLGAPAAQEPLSLVIYAADALNLVDLLAAGRRSLAAGCPVLPGLLVGEQFLVGPLMRAPACPVCTFTRIAQAIWDPARLETMVRSIEASHGELDAHGGASAALARQLGGDLAFEAFKWLAGSFRPDVERGTVVHTATEAADGRAVFVPCTSHWCRSGCRVLETGPVGVRVE